MTTKDEPCPSGNVKLTITLPADRTAPPTVSDRELHVKKGAQVQIELVDRVDRSNSSQQEHPAATVLRFPEETPFVNRGGQPMHTLPLTRPGLQTVTIREDIDCPSSGGRRCKYDVSNHGDKERKVLDPHIIVWE